MVEKNKEIKKIDRKFSEKKINHVQESFMIREFFGKNSISYIPKNLSPTLIQARKKTIMIPEKNHHDQYK